MVPGATIKTGKRAPHWDPEPRIAILGSHEAPGRHPNRKAGIARARNHHSKTVHQGP